MHRFYLPPQETTGDVLLLRDREAHHGAHVLRLEAGDTVEVLNGAGTRLACEVMRATRKELSLTVRQRTAVARPPFDITLLQAIVKGKTMETIIQKGTELGLTRIVPIQTERVVSHLDNEGAQSKQAKWQLIGIEAIKQCGSAWLPRIDTPITPGAFLRRGEKFDLSLVGSLEGDGRHARHWFQSLSRAPRHVAVWIGPEGDFTPGELELIRASGAKPITLGDLVLRADTAAIYSISVIRHELEAFTAIGPEL
jgi:16S rRNA (uracil1498-N3)-methyltransferase